MGALFEFVIYSLKPILFDFLLNRVKNRCEVEVLEIEISQDWDSINTKTTNQYNKSLFERCLIEGKRMTVRCKINNKFNSGYSFSQVSKFVFETSLWVDTEIFPSLDADFITNLTKNVYDELTREIIFSFKDKDLLIVAVGSEINVEFIDNIKKMIDVSYNVNRWIVPSELDLSMDFKYVVSFIDGYKIYSNEKQ
ncbi:hypothetical protein NYE37_10590 [Thermoactinomyces sp. FSL K6-2592]|uniref:hypothetical protein n=1 Tax=Thermoactinomyces sp. FSL K6-2592 TaxID=2975347 RepID=UPI0030F5D328